MTIWTHAELDEQIAAFKKGLLVIAGGQSYQIGGDTYTRADLLAMQKTLDYLNQQKLSLSRSGGPRMVPGRVRR